MQNERFLSNSPKVEHIIRGLSLSKSLLVSSILIGEPYTGKKYLAKSIFPKASIIDARDSSDMGAILQKHDELIITHFEHLKDNEIPDFLNKRVIAIADTPYEISRAESRFAFVYEMPSLSQRIEDIPLLKKHLCSKIKEELMITKDTDIDISQLDISDNMRSLKASIYRILVTGDLNQQALEDLLYRFLEPRIIGNNAYRDLLGIFERPLIKAGISKYKSQLKLSEILGLNRNTLRKKMHEHNLD